MKFNEQKPRTANRRYVELKSQRSCNFNIFPFFDQDVFEKVKADIRLMREELNNIERSKQPKERSLAQLRSSLEAMQSTKEGLESELHQELMTQLSVNDQLEVDRLNDDIRRLTQENKDAFIQRMRLEADKNKLENLLTNNLIRRYFHLICFYYA